MKTKTVINEITHDELVDLFSTATYCSGWLSIKKRKSDYYGTPLENDSDCSEDTWAKVLLAGKTIFVCDFYAEDENDHYGNLPYKWDGHSKCMKYEINLEQLKAGLARCFDSDNVWLTQCAQHFKEGEGNMDMIEAEMLMQEIVFGEQVYG